MAHLGPSPYPGCELSEISYSHPGVIYFLLEPFVSYPQSLNPCCLPVPCLLLTFSLNDLQDGLSEERPHVPLLHLLHLASQCWWEEWWPFFPGGQGLTTWPVVSPGYHLDCRTLGLYLVCSSCWPESKCSVTHFDGIGEGNFTWVLFVFYQTSKSVTSQSHRDMILPQC